MACPWWAAERSIVAVFMIVPFVLIDHEARTVPNRPVGWD
jgi:hypothetical protein